MGEITQLEPSSNCVVTISQTRRVSEGSPRSRVGLVARILVRRSLILIASLSLISLALAIEASGAPFALRGYYITLMRMPVMGLVEWKQAVDCFAEDDANVL